MRWLLKRWWFWIVAGFMVVALVVGYLVIPFGEGQISQANCDRIQLGWSPRQVGSLLRDNEILNLPDRAQVFGIGLTARDEDGNRIEVRFTSLGVTHKKYVPTNLSFLECVKGRVERRLRALWP